MSDSPNPLAELCLVLDRAREASTTAWADKPGSVFDNADLITAEATAWSAVSTAFAAAEAEREAMREALEKIARVTGTSTEANLVARRALNPEPSDA